ncbi:MAG: hypothetical protein ACSHX6_10165 [Akkermansiaceae bacterium]
MKSTKLSDTEIYSIIAMEISTSRLDGACREKAELESGGNYDLMISRYFLMRIEELKEKNVECGYKEAALEQRKVDAANKIIRNRVNKVKGRSRLMGVRRDVFFSSIIWNVILIVSTISAMSAYLVLRGDSLQNLPYASIIGVLITCLVLPCALSNMTLKSNPIQYRTILSAFCIIMCLGSLVSGLLLMKKGPRVMVGNVETSGFIETYDMETQDSEGHEEQVNLEYSNEDYSMCDEEVFRAYY